MTDPVAHSVAVVGAGAVGTVVAHACVDSGMRPMVFRRTHRARLALRFEHEEPLEWGDRVEHAAPQDATPCGLVFVATKAHDTASTAELLARLVLPTSLVVVLQNGVEHVERVAPLVPRYATVIPAVVDCPATRDESGLVLLRRRARVLLPDGPAGRAVAARFRGTFEPVSFGVEVDFVSALWRKLCVNVVSGSIPALTDSPARVFRQPSIVGLCRALIAEAATIGRAEGAALPRDIGDEVLAEFQSAPPDAVNAMLLDRRLGRPLEWDARHGAVIRFGRKHGVPTPANEAVAALLEALSSRAPNSRAAGTGA